jgi:hypothetical protein
MKRILQSQGNEMHLFSPPLGTWGVARQEIECQSSFIIFIQINRSDISLKDTEIFYPIDKFPLYTQLLMLVSNTCY